MKDDKIYSNDEIKKLTKDINTIHYIGDLKYNNEEFRQIKIMNGFIPYLISSYGRIFSINFAGKYHNIRQLKTNVNDITGYERITITYDDIIVSLSIHRLVAFAFIKNDDLDKIEINHKDGNKINNVVENLEWATPSQNIIHAFKNNLKCKGEKHPMNKYSIAQVKMVCELMSNDYSIQDIQKIAGVSKNTIKDILNKNLGLI